MMPLEEQEARIAAFLAVRAAPATDRMEAERLERDCGCAGTAGCGSRYCPRPSP